MIRLKVVIEKFAEQGEKTGWTYFRIPAAQAQLLKKGQKTSFRVKGYLDKVAISGQAILPMGGGEFILTLKADLRKKLGKRQGDTLVAQLEADEEPFRFDADFLSCLDEEPAAKAQFKSLSPSHQRYFSNWIAEAKTEGTRTKRLAEAINALEKGWGFPEMLRARKA